MGTTPQASRQMQLVACLYPFACRWRNVMAMKFRALMPMILSVALSACASNVPRAISQEPGTPISVAQARGGIENLSGQSVRWGGKIAGVENHKTETWVEIVQLPLNHFGRPVEGDSSDGRFIARIEGFLDPQVYTKDRLITVAGTLEKITQRPIGEYSYTYPLMHAVVYYLWSPTADRHSCLAGGQFTPVARGIHGGRPDA